MRSNSAQAILTLMEEHPGPDGRPRPIVWAGEEIDRYGLGGELVDLVEATGVPFCTTVGAKAVAGEDLPQFHGVYNGKASHPDVRAIFKEWATCRIGLGAWSTSKNLDGEQSVGTDWVTAAHGGISVGTSYFPDVQLVQLLPALQDALVKAYGAGNRVLTSAVGLAFRAGVPSFAEVVEGPLNALFEEGVTAASEAREVNPLGAGLLERYFTRLAYVAHGELKELSAGAWLAVCAGEARPYPHVLLRCGVFVSPR